jgi:two-component system response regulator RegX3
VHEFLPPSRSDRLRGIGLIVGLLSLFALISALVDDDASVTVAAPGTDGSVLEVGDIALDKERHEVLREFQLLALLMENAGIVVTRQTLIDRVWGFDYVGDTKTLDVHVKRLRAKVEPSPDRPERLVTIRGLGYKLNS